MSQAVSDQIAIVLIAHGSRHQPANDDLKALATRVSAQNTCPIVEPAFLELADPSIEQAGDSAVARGATRILMIPYFLAAGVHLIRDLTAARDSLRLKYPHVRFELGDPLGPHPLLDQLVLERIRELEMKGEQLDRKSSEEMARTYQPMGNHDSD